MDLKEKGRKILEKSINLFSHPYARRLSKFAKLTLETIHMVKNSESPLAAAVGGISVIHSAIDAFELPLPTKIEQWTKNADLVENFGHLALIIVSTGLIEKSNCKTVCVDEGSLLREINFDFGSFYFIEGQETGVYYENDLDRIHGYFYTTKDFAYEKLFELLWARFDNGIFLSINSADEDSFSSRNIRLHKLSTHAMFYLGEEPSVSSLVEEIREYRKDGVSRSYMLAGLPGTGKSSISVMIAKELNGRIVKVDPSIARQMGSAEFEFIVKNLSPDIILFDDFDRAVDGSEQLLFTIENIKQQFPNIVIFATVNNFDMLDPALRRPGRFDQTIWFLLPEKKEREQILSHYLDKQGVECSKRKLAELAKQTEGLSPAYLKEICTRIRRKGWDCVDSTIIEFARTLGATTEMEEEEVDDTED
jgi:hypothetical protein